MALAAGEKLGPYQIIGKIGQGGMGEVYRAQDTKLKREVAIKVLPDSFGVDAGRRARFQREAEVLASLDHPNIGAIHGLVEVGHTQALVLALIEGPTLDERIAAGPLPLEEALSIAKQIIAALEYAHDRGIVHRDLKPANIKITPEGGVKVLDFGLAKVLDDDLQQASTADSPTLTLGHTRAGVILGTAAYMSPEQAVGKAADRRSDIFSFGAVFYEMLTARRAFLGDSGPEVLIAVAKDEPDWSRLPAGIPRTVLDMLRRCLVKDRKQRMQAIGEARIALENPPTPEVMPTAAARHLWVPWIAAGAAIIVAAIALWAPWTNRSLSDQPLLRLDIDLGADLRFPPIDAGYFALSSDGSRLVFPARPARGGPVTLHVRRWDQPAAVELRGTDAATLPFFSTDEKWIAFAAGSRLSKVSIEGGSIVPIGDITGFLGGAWLDDGSLLAGIIFQGLKRFPPNGSSPELIAAITKEEAGLGFPQVLPGGSAILLTTYTTPDVDGARIQVLTLADKKMKHLFPGGTTARYVPTWRNAGHILYANRSTMFAIPFDLERMEINGAPVPIFNDIAYLSPTGVTNYDISAAPFGHGTLVYRKSAAGESPEVTVTWLDSLGKTQPLLAKPGFYNWSRLSPDGKRLALLTLVGSKLENWVYDTERDTVTFLTSDVAFGRPVWHPNGQMIVFGGAGGFSWTRADGSSQPQRLTESQRIDVPTSVSPDGKAVAFTRFGADQEIWTVPVEESAGGLKAQTPQLYVKAQAIATDAKFSPDGRWIAYVSDEPGTMQVSVRPYPAPPGGAGGKWQVSNNTGANPVWSRTASELLYQSGDQIMSVHYSIQGGTFVPEKPRVWAEHVRGTLMDLSPDGKRAVMLSPVQTGEAPQEEHELVFVQNFFDELRRRAPMPK